MLQIDCSCKSCFDLSLTFNLQYVQVNNPPKCISLLKQGVYILHHIDMLA